MAECLDSALRRDKFLADVEAALVASGEKMRLFAFGGSVDELWGFAHDLVLNVARMHFARKPSRPPQRSDDTEALLEARAHRHRRRELLLEGVFSATR